MNLTGCIFYADVVGGDLQNHSPVTDFGTCLDLCRQRADCLLATLMTNPGRDRCLLKGDSTTAPTPRGGRTSSPRYCGEMD